MFQGLSTSLTALYASRLALETTGNNIANANTEGYSRQRVEQSPITNSFVSFHGNSGNVGVGVRVEDIVRLRDQFLETRALAETSRSGELQQMTDTYATIEVSFGEPGENGLQSQLSAFWSSWDDLANNPGDLATRSQVVEQAETLVSSFQQAGSALTTLGTNSLALLKGDVNQINGMAQNITELNRAIRSATNAGESPNTLLDERDLLVNQLSSLIGITVQPTEANSVAILVNGVSLVRDERVTFLQVDDTASPVVLRWDNDGDASTINDGVQAFVSGGEVGALMTTLTGTVPQFQGLLDNVAAKLIANVNTLHTAGRDQNGAVGLAFFTGTDASTIAVNPAIVANKARVAAAAAGGGTLDAENARAIANLASSLTGADSDYRQLVDVLGTASQRAGRQYAIQTDITNAVNASREAVSGVSLDEEMTNMVRYQQAYNAAAKYLTVLNDTMDSLMGMIR